MKFAKALLSAVALTSSVHGQTDDQKAANPGLTEIMGIYNYQWEPIPVTTDDGYTLTLIRVSGNKNKVLTPTKGPVLMVPSTGTDVETWLGYYFGTVPTADALPLELYKQGYDVYMSYGRGQLPSNVKAGCDYDDACFWNYTFTDELLDTKAQVQYIYGQTGQKVNVMGMAIGNIQLFAAMGTQAAWFSQYTNKFALVEPCMIQTQDMWNFVNEDFVTTNDALGIYEFGGPTWYLTTEAMSRTYGKTPLWYFMVQGFGGAGLKPIASKWLYHIRQNSEQQVFQTYSDTYYAATDAQKVTTPIVISENTSIPVGMFVPQNDTYCPQQWAQSAATQLGEMNTFYKVYNETQDTMSYLNTDEFQQDLDSFFQGTQQKEKKRIWDWFF